MFTRCLFTVDVYSQLDTCQYGRVKKHYLEKFKNIENKSINQAIKDRLEVDMPKTFANRTNKKSHKSSMKIHFILIVKIANYYKLKISRDIKIS